MMPTAEKRYRATAIIAVAGIGDHIGAIVDSIATHDMEVIEAQGVHHVASPFGSASLRLVDLGLELTAEAAEAGALNRLKHALVGPIGFIVARDMTDICWKGDFGEPALPDDLRILHVRRIEELTPRMRRITFHGSDLARYDRKDQLHCRLIFQERGIARPRWPMLDHRGQVVWPDDANVPTRVYTIRHIDLASQEIVIDFCIHHDPGPATRWAMDARVDDLVGILGPAANGPKEADFHVLAGDETALPGIARILQSMAADATGFALIEVGDPSDRLPLHHPDGMTIRWLYRNEAAPGAATLLETAVRAISWPERRDRSFFWGGCEHKPFSAIYRYLRHEVRLPRDRMVFYSHWHRSLSEDDIISQGAEAYLPTSVA